MKEHFTKQALIGTGILFVTVVLAVAASNVWVTPMLAKAVNKMNTNPPATA